MSSSKSRPLPATLGGKLRAFEHAARVVGFARQGADFGAGSTGFKAVDQDAPFLVAHAGDEMRQTRGRVWRDIAVVPRMQAHRRAVGSDGKAHHAANAKRHARHAARVHGAVAKDPDISVEQIAVRGRIEADSGWLAPVCRHEKLVRSDFKALSPQEKIAYQSAHSGRPTISTEFAVAGPGSARSTARGLAKNWRHHGRAIRSV